MIVNYCVRNALVWRTFYPKQFSFTLSLVIKILDTGPQVLEWWILISYVVPHYHISLLREETAGILRF